MRRTVLLSTFLFAAALVLLQSDYCSLSPYPKLSKLELYVPDINGQNVISGFRPDGILYKVELSLEPPDTAVLVVEVDPQYAGATVEVTHNSLPVPLGLSGQAPLTLAPDHSEIRVTVTAQDGRGLTYTVSVDRVDYCPCDDGNICTHNFCIDDVCEYPPVPDGSICADLKGVCYQGVCSYVPVSVSIGPKEVVFDWTTDRCEDLDLPDGPARAVRMEDGEIVLFAGDAPTYYVSRGPDFDTLQHVCDPPALVSADLQTPESYENWEWIWGTYREGTSIHALIHNEFHDAVAPTCKVGDPSPANPCWYNSITYAVSTDGGRSFSKPGAPAHVIAAAPEVWTPPTTPQPHGFVSLIGYHGPGNIVRGPDDYYYALILLTPSQGDAYTFRCLMRTDALDDPASWRAWDGTGFNLHMESPYVTGNPVPTCARVNVGGASLTYNSYLGQYMAVDNGGSGGDCGIYLWLSPDLIHWGRPQLIVPARWWGCEEVSETPLEPGWAQYTAIIDHADSTPNFERPGRTPYLYYTRFNEGGSLDRDLVRVPLTFTIDGPLCAGVECDDRKECTLDVCDGASGVCDFLPIQDGVLCADGMGICRAGFCQMPDISFTGPQEDVIGLGEWGLWCVPDEHISYYKTDDTFHVWFTQGEAHHFTSPDFDELTPSTVLDGSSVPAFGPTGEGFDNSYAGPGSVIRASNGQDLLMFYHGEDHQWDGQLPPELQGAFYSSIGLARSIDEGQTWERLGVVISARDPKPASPIRFASGAGAPSVRVNEADGFIYLYYADLPTLQGPATGMDEIHVARAPISSDGVPGSWMKYFQGAFSEPGLAGSSEAVIRGPSSQAFWSGFPSVSYNDALDAYLAVFVSLDGFYVSTSSDGLNWSVGRRFLAAPPPSTGDPMYRYPSLLSPSQPTDATTSDTGYLYYGYGIFDVECHHMVRRAVQIRWETGRCEEVDCDDQNDCTEDRCDAVTGVCDNDPLPNGSACDVGGVPGLCDNGQCAVP